MRRSQLIPAALAIVLVVLVAAAIGVGMPGGSGPETPSPPASVSLDPSPSPASTTPAPATASTGDPRLAWTEFLLRAGDAGAKIGDLNAVLGGALDDRDGSAALDAADAIHEFVIVEHAWLGGHPPAACFRDAHAAAGAMLAAYDEVAALASRWAAAGGGVAGLQALAAALDAYRVAGDALEELGRAIQAQTCLR